MTTYGIDRTSGAGGSGASTTTLVADGSQPLTADWDAGNFGITALSFIASGASPTFELIRAIDTQSNSIEFQESDGSVRWKLNHAGTGSNNDFSLQRYNASGTLQDSPITVSGTDGLVTVLDAAFSQGVYLTGTISPSQITSNQNDWAPTSFADSNTIRVTSDAARTITGIAGGSAGRNIVLHNVGSFDITLSDESSSSTAANRFALTENFILGSDTSVALYYDGTSSRWRVVGARNRTAQQLADELQQLMMKGEVQTLSGSSVDFTGIPSWVTRIDIAIDGLSHNSAGSAIVGLQIGDSGGVENSGYNGSVCAWSTTVSSTLHSTYFALTAGSGSATTHQGHATLCLVDASTNTWALSGILGRGDAAAGYMFAGTKALTGTLDRIRLLMVTDSFDAGKMTVRYS